MAEDNAKYLAELEEANAFLRKLGRRIDTIVVLGSGMGGVLTKAKDHLSVPYEEIPNFPRSTVKGHGGKLTLCRIGDRNLAALEGRVHMYEGHSAARVAFHVRALLFAGAQSLVITNAAGSVRPGLVAGDIMLIENHLSLFVEDPAIGLDDPRLGERFYDTSYCYDPALIAIAEQEAAKLSIKVQRGVYVMSRGPRYESAVDTKALHMLGADVLGMSTVPEVLAARQKGIGKILGLTLVSNLAAGISPTKLSHHEVLEAGRQASDRTSALLCAVLAREDW